MVHDILNDNKGKHVDVSIDSLGGEVSAGLAICQMFKSHGDVTVDFQAGFSASAATICAMGANKIRMSKYTLLLVHKCSTEQFVWSALNEEEIGSLIEQLQKQQETSRNRQHYRQRLLRPLRQNHEDIIKVMSEARWHTVGECIELGLSMKSWMASLPRLPSRHKTLSSTTTFQYCQRLSIHGTRRSQASLTVCLEKTNHITLFKYDQEMDSH